MSNKLKEIDIKNCTCYFSDDIINLEIKIKIDEKSYKNTLIFRIGYLAVKDLSYTTIHGINPLMSLLIK